MSLNLIRVVDRETKKPVSGVKAEITGIYFGPNETDLNGTIPLITLPFLRNHIKLIKEGYTLLESDLTSYTPINPVELIISKPTPEIPEVRPPFVTPPEVYRPPEYIPTPIVVPTPAPEVPTVTPVVAPTLHYQLYLSSNPISTELSYNTTKTKTPLNISLPAGTYAVVIPSEIMADKKTYKFSEWSDGSTLAARNIALDRDLSLTAIYELVSLPPTIEKPPAPTLCNLTIRATEGGTTYPAPGVYQYYQGTPTSVKALPNKDYALNYWKLDGVTVEPSTIRSFNMNTDRFIEAVFKYVPIEVKPPAEIVPITPITPPTLPQLKQSFPIPYSPTLLTGFTEGAKSEERAIEVKWDSKATMINQIVLRGSIHAVQPPAAPSVGFQFSVYGRPAVSRDWLTGCSTSTFDTNIGAKMINGTNIFKIETHKNTIGLGACGIDTILIVIEVQFTGVPPIVSPVTGLRS